MIAEISTLHYASKNVHSENEKCESYTDLVLKMFSETNKTQRDGKNDFETPDDKEIKRQRET